MPTPTCSFESKPSLFASASDKELSTREPSEGQLVSSGLIFLTILRVKRCAYGYRTERPTTDIGVFSEDLPTSLDYTEICWAFSLATDREFANSITVRRPRFHCSLQLI